MNAGPSAEALYTRLESDVSKAVTCVDLTLVRGVPSTRSKLPDLSAPINAVFDTVAEIKRIAASERPNAIGK